MLWEAISLTHLFCWSKWLWRQFLWYFSLTKPYYWTFFESGVRLPGKQTSRHRHAPCHLKTVVLLLRLKKKKNQQTQNDWAQCFHSILFLAASKSFLTNNEIIPWQETKNISLPRPGKERYIFWQLPRKFTAKNSNSSQLLGPAVLFETHCSPASSIHFLYLASTSDTLNLGGVMFFWPQWVALSPCSL